MGSDFLQQYKTQVNILEYYDPKPNKIFNNFFLYTVTTTYKNKAISVIVHQVFYKNSKHNSVFLCKNKYIVNRYEWLCKLFLLKTNNKGI